MDSSLFRVLERRFNGQPTWLAEAVERGSVDGTDGYIELRTL